jgi:hypothetical protein
LVVGGDEGPLVVVDFGPVAGGAAVGGVVGPGLLGGGPDVVEPGGDDVVVDPAGILPADGSNRPGNDLGVTKSPESTLFATADMNRLKIVAGNEPPLSLATPCTPASDFD